MPPDPLEALRFETPKWLAKRPDLAHLEHQLEGAVARAETQRAQFGDERKRLRSEWQDRLINSAGSGLATVGLLKMMAATTLVFSDLLIGGGGSLLTLWGGNRFRRKIEAERDLARRIVALTERVEHLAQSLSQVRKARELQNAAAPPGGR